jgi:hypothetical protein
MEAGATANPAARPRKETVSASGPQLRPPQSASAPRRALVTIRTPMNSSSPHLASEEEFPIHPAISHHLRQRLSGAGNSVLSLSGSAQFIPSQHLEIVHRARDFRNSAPRARMDTTSLCLLLTLPLCVCRWRSFATSRCTVSRWTVPYFPGTSPFDAQLFFAYGWSEVERA